MRFSSRDRRCEFGCSHQHHLKRPCASFHTTPVNISSVSVTSPPHGPHSGQRSDLTILSPVTIFNWRLRKQLSFCSHPTLLLSSFNCSSKQTGQPPSITSSRLHRSFICSSRSSFVSPFLPIKANVGQIRARPTARRRTNRFFTTTAMIHSAIDPASKIIAMAAMAFDLNHSDVKLTGTIMTVVFGWLALWQILTSQKIVPSIATRKVFHLTCGPAFVALWPLYSDSAMARITAASVPLLFTTLLTISGLSANKGASGLRGTLGRMLSRGGNARDALQGPLYYTVVLLGLTLLLFKSVIAAIAVTQLCFGDAVAEIIGRRFGATLQWHLPGTGNKSVVGSFAFVLAALIGSVIAIQWFHYCNCSSLQLNDIHVLVQLVIISIACSATELGSTMVSLDDNLAISTVAVILCIFMFGTQV